MRPRLLTRRDGCLLAPPRTPLTRLRAPAAYQKAVKEQRLALELASATRERDFYMKQVEQGKAIDAMAAKQQRRAQAAAEEAGGAGGERGAQEPPKAKGGGARFVRTFQQVRSTRVAAGTRWLGSRVASRAEARASRARRAVAVAERAGAGVRHGSAAAARGRCCGWRGRRGAAAQEAKSASGAVSRGPCARYCNNDIRRDERARLCRNALQSKAKSASEVSVGLKTAARLLAARRPFIR